jgi:NAD(P)-dependent dehydrogenase (short-subunit alcohol dehydrogenase family)
MTPQLPDSSQLERTFDREASLAGRLVVITGAASGIGRALALECARRGARLALSDLSREGLVSVQAEIEALGVGLPLPLLHELDVSDRQRVTAWAAEVEGELGPVHTIVNMAGVALHCPLDETTPEDFEWVMATNFWGTVHATQAFLPQLKRQGRGHVINVSSAFGLVAFPASGAYVASKFAVRGFTETLALELAITHPAIVVTSVHPGGVETPLLRRARVRGTGPLSSSPDRVALAFERDLARTSARACAECIAATMQKSDRRLIIGLDAKVLDWLVRLFPSFHQRLLVWLLRRHASR